MNTRSTRVEECRAQIREKECNWPGHVMPRIDADRWVLESGSGREMTWGEEKKVCRPGTWLHDPSCSSACGATLPHILHIGSLC